MQQNFTYAYAGSSPFTVIHENGVVDYRGICFEIILESIINGVVTIIDMVLDLLYIGFYNLLLFIYKMAEIMMNTDITVKMFEIDFINSILLIACTIGLLLALSVIDKKLAQLEQYTKTLKKSIDNDVVIINKQEYEMLINNVRLYNLKSKKYHLKEKNY